jgi:hypothetical protein
MQAVRDQASAQALGLRSRAAPCHDACRTAPPWHLRGGEHLPSGFADRQTNVPERSLRSARRPWLQGRHRRGGPGTPWRRNPGQPCAGRGNSPYTSGVDARATTHAVMQRNPLVAVPSRARRGPRPR